LCRVFFENHVTFLLKKGLVGEADAAFKGESDLERFQEHSAPRTHPLRRLDLLLIEIVSTLA